MIPTMRPKVAPIAMEGTKIPAGTLHPYDTMTSNTRMHVASKREFTIRHWADVLEVADEPDSSGLGRYELTRIDVQSHPHPRTRGRG